MVLMCQIPSKNNLNTMLRKYSVAGIITEILDLKYLYVETHINAYYNPSLASNSDSVKAVISNNINSYADSSEMNKYGAKFKYSKFQAVVDNSNNSITSNSTKQRDKLQINSDEKKGKIRVSKSTNKEVK